MRYSKQRELVMQTVENLCDHPPPKRFTTPLQRNARA